MATTLKNINFLTKIFLNFIEKNKNLFIYHNLIHKWAIKK